MNVPLLMLVVVLLLLPCWLCCLRPIPHFVSCGFFHPQAAGWRQATTAFACRQGGTRLHMRAWPSDLTPLPPLCVHCPFCAAAPYDGPPHCGHTNIAVEEVKVALLGALGQWLPAVPVTPPADAVTVLRTSLSEAKDGPRRAALAAAAAALAAAPELAVPLAPLATELVALASEGATKAVSRGPGLCALALAAALEGASSQALVRLCGESSPLLSAATLARLPPSEAAAAAGVARALLSTYETLPPGEWV